MARLGTPVWPPKIPPKSFMWVPSLRPFPGNEAGGGQKVYVERVYVLFRSLQMPDREVKQTSGEAVVQTREDWQRFSQTLTSEAKLEDFRAFSVLGSKGQRTRWKVPRTSIV